MKCSLATALLGSTYAASSTIRLMHNDGDCMLQNIGGTIRSTCDVQLPSGQNAGSERPVVQELIDFIRQKDCPAEMGSNMIAHTQGARTIDKGFCKFNCANNHHDEHSTGACHACKTVAQCPVGELHVDVCSTTSDNTCTPCTTKPEPHASYDEAGTCHFTCHAGWAGVDCDVCAQGYKLEGSECVAQNVNLGCKMVRQGGGGAGTATTAECPNGYVVTGGGFVDIDQNGGGSASDEFTSWPNGNGWYTRFDDEVGGYDSFAICCRAESMDGSTHPAFTFQCTTQEHGGGSASHTIQSSCPAGSTYLGGGFHDIDQNGGGSASDEFTVKPSGTGYFAQFQDEVGGFTVRTQCCQFVSSDATSTFTPECRNVDVGGGSNGNPVYAQCADDEMLVGGGFNDIDQNGGGSASDEFSSCPSTGSGCADSHTMTTGEKWWVRFEDEVGGFNSIARCCKQSTSLKK